MSLIIGSWSVVTLYMTSTICLTLLLLLQFADPPDWTEILAYFRGSELQNYFTKILEDDLKAVMKPQYVDQIPRDELYIKNRSFRKSIISKRKGLREVLLS